jgi:hypothetical protein
MISTRTGYLVDGLVMAVLDQAPFLDARRIAACARSVGVRVRKADVRSAIRRLQSVGAVAPVGRFRPGWWMSKRPGSVRFAEVVWQVARERGVPEWGLAARAAMDACELIRRAYDNDEFTCRLTCEVTPAPEWTRTWKLRTVGYTAAGEMFGCDDYVCYSDVRHLRGAGAELIARRVLEKLAPLAEQAGGGR